MRISDWSSDVCSSDLQQIKVCKAANGHAHTIRRMLTTEKVDTTSGAFLFVRRDAYEAKGGTITVDLFSQGAEGFADQPELVQELAEEKQIGSASWRERVCQYVYISVVGV